MMRTVKQSTSIAGGMDSIVPAEAKMYPVAFWDRTAALFSAIERTGRWPVQLLHAKAVFLLKPDEDPTDMGSYRVLMITPLLYRIWAKVRSRQLSRWTATWTRGELYATAPGTGAGDAHAAYALRIEHAIARELAYAGVVTDLSQAFDRLLREIRVPIAILAGFPLQLIRAWYAYRGCRSPLPTRWARAAPSSAPSPSRKDVPSPWQWSPSS